MVKYVYKIYILINKYKWKTVSKVYYRLARIGLNLYLPFYYRIVGKNIKGTTNQKRDKRIVVSLTTFPARIDTVWITLESLLRQTVKPDEIILWLADTQFDGIENLPKKVTDLQVRGLKIQFCSDLKSHKKYFYAMKKYPNDLIVTVDDDLIYPEDMIEELYESYKINPNCIICHRAHKITFDKNNKIRKYKEWEYCALGSKGPSQLLCPTSGAGTLYPPHLYKNILLDKNNIIKLSLNADDIWLKMHAILSEIPVVKVNPYYKEVISIFNTNKNGLARTNVLENGNDEQLEKIIDYYKIDIEEIQNK